MKIAYRKILTGIVLLWIGSCVEPYDPKLGPGVRRLVVEGLVTDQPGPYTVKLTYSAGYTNGSGGQISRATDAQVYITDDAGNRADLRETSRGVYQTNAGSFRGQVGRAYQVHIQTADGERYESKPDVLPPVPPIDSVYWEFKSGSDAEARGIYLYIDTKDPATPDNYYRWAWTHYETMQYCREAYDPAQGQTYSYSCCVPCWAIARCYGCVNIASDAYVNGNEIARQRITIAPFDSRSKYYIEIEQYSLSREAYQFWKLLKDQSSSTGGPFDPPPATVQGNIVNLTHPDAGAVGFFGASALYTLPYWIDRSNIEGTPAVRQYPPLPPGLPPCAECEESVNTTAIQPRFWVW